MTTRQLLTAEDFRFGRNADFEDSQFWCRHERLDEGISSRSINSATTGNNFYGGTYQTFEPQKLNRLTVWTLGFTPNNPVTVHFGIYQAPNGKVALASLLAKGTISNPTANTEYLVTLDAIAHLERGLYWLIYGAVGVGTITMMGVNYSSSQVLQAGGTTYHLPGFVVKTKRLVPPATLDPLVGGADCGYLAQTTALWARGSLV